MVLVAVYPFIEGWITGDKREHHILDRPRNAPTRTGIGVAGVIFYATLWGAASSDILATQFRLSIESVTHAYQALLILGPIVGFVIARQVALALQRKDRELVLHGVETGRIVRLPGGEYIEVHRELDAYERWRLVDFEEHAPLMLRPDARGRITVLQRLRVRLSRFFFEDRVSPVTRKELCWSSESRVDGDHRLTRAPSLETMSMPEPDIDSATAEFETVRPRLFGIAYRMLGTVAEAEDVVQDAWIRWQGTDRSQVRNPSAFLSTVTTRLSINASDSARARREVYAGPWLPEPVLTENDPTLGAERTEALEIGLLLLLERLTPNERAVYVLREAFAYDFGDIAEVLETSESNARQLARRARTHLVEHRSKQVTAAERDRLLRAFLAAAQSGDLEQLESVLAEDVVVYSDGGGVVSAARRPVVGRDRVSSFSLAVPELHRRRVDLLHRGQRRDRRSPVPRRRAFRSRLDHRRRARHRTPLLRPQPGQAARTALVNWAGGRDDDR